MSTARGGSPVGSFSIHRSASNRANHTGVRSCPRSIRWLRLFAAEMSAKKYNQPLGRHVVCGTAHLIDTTKRHVVGHAVCGIDIFCQRSVIRIPLYGIGKDAADLM